MSENAHGGSAQKKRFSSDGGSGAAEYKVRKRWARAALVVKKVGGMPPGALGLGCTLFWMIKPHKHWNIPKSRTCARMAERSSSSCSRSHARGHGGDLWTEIMKHETTEAFTGRSRLVFVRLETERVNLPSEARGHIVLHGCRLGSLGRATIISATRRNWEFDEVCTAIRTSSPCCQDRWSHGTVCMSWKTESRMSLRITWTLEETRSLNPRLRPSWLL